MKRLLSLWLAVWAVTLSVPAYVTDNAGTANAKHWSLLTAYPGVSTNVVNPTTKAIRYFLSSDGYSPTNTAAELNGVRAAFAQWQTVSNTYLKFEEAGLVSGTVDVNVSDNTNVVYWAKNSTLVKNGTSDISGASGVTFTSWNPTDNTLLQADIVFNGTAELIPGCGIARRWITDFSDPDDDCGVSFVEGVALHEIGHFIGLAHSPVGNATMLFRGLYGVNVQAGLAADDIKGAQFVYPVTRTNTGAVRGAVTKNGNVVFGAQVFIQDAATNIVAGTVTRTNGVYEINMLAPGAYHIRVAPPDPATSPRLVTGVDIGSDFNGSDTAFLPTTNVPVTITANATNTTNLTVSNRAPSFRITHIRLPSTVNSYSWASLPAKLTVGQSNLYTGVASATLPTSNATLTITGDGLTLGPTVIETNLFSSGLTFLSVSISVASNATPGARSFVVTQYGTNVAYANGFLEIQPAFPDFNFDGFDDRFQRQYFPLFTATNAAAAADPDSDGMNNYAEYIAGTNPTNAASLLRLQGVTRTANNATINWQSVAGEKYQVVYRTNVAAGNWLNVGGIVTANGVTAQFTDTTATNEYRFYRVQALP